MIRKGNLAVTGKTVADTKEGSIIKPLGSCSSLHAVTI